MIRAASCSDVFYWFSFSRDFVSLRFEEVSVRVCLTRGEGGRGGGREGGEGGGG